MLIKLNEKTRFLQKSQIDFIIFLIFHTIIIDFILKFSFFENEFNIMMILTNKFNQKIIITLEKNI